MQTCVRVKRRFGRSAVAGALRDRFKHSDLETGRFFHKTCQFSVIARRAHSLRGIAPHRFSNVSFRKLFRFPAKPTRFVIARRAQFLRPTRQSLTERFAIPKRTMVARNETKPWKEERGSKTTRRIPFFVIGLPSCFVLPCFATGCHTSNFKIATSLRSSQ